MQYESKTRPDVPTLATELLNEIVNWALIYPGKPVLHNLCLTSKAFCALAQPLLLQHIRIGTSTVFSQTNRIAQLDALANRDCLASKHARTLVIDYSGSFEDRTSVLTRLDKCMQKNLLRALESFKRVEKVIWYPGKNEHSWVHETIAKALEKFSLKQVCIEWLERISAPDHHHGTIRRLQEFPAIVQNLASRSINISHVDLNITNNTEDIAPLVHSLPTSIEHFGLVGSFHVGQIPPDAVKSLTSFKKFKSLTLHTNLPSWFRYRNLNWEPWSIFKKECLQLLHIYTDTRIDTRFMSYLDSYNNLQHLTLELRNFGYTTQSGPVDLCSPADLLKVLSTRHAFCLVKLGLHAHNMRDVWIWPFDEEVKSLLGSLTKLEYLELSAYNASESDIETLLSFCENAFPALIQLTLNGLWYDTGVCGGQYRPPFFHRGKDHPFIESPSLARAITAFQSKQAPGRKPFVVMLGAITYTRRVNPDTGIYGYAEWEV